MTEELVAMQVEREPWEEPADVEDPVAPPLERVHAGVEPLHKPTRLPTLKVVRDLLHPPIDRPQNAFELRQPAGTHPLAPGPNRALGPRLRVAAREPVCQVFPQVVGRFDLRRAGEAPLEPLPFLRLEIPRPLAKWPHRPLELGIRRCGQRSLEPLERLLAQSVGAVVLCPRHKHPILHYLPTHDLPISRPSAAF